MVPGTGSTAIDVRPAGEDDGPDWHRAVRTGFLGQPAPEEEVRAWWREHHAPGRFLGAWDGPRCVGTLRSIPMDVTVPGGEVLPADGVASVTVAATHRRRGLLRRLVDLDLDLARRRGEALALLTASEHGIYGRFGFGHALRYGGWAVDVLRSGGLRPGVGELAPGARIDLVDPAELRQVGPPLHERTRRLRAGVVSRSAEDWREVTGEVTSPGGRNSRPFAAVHRDPDGEVTGILAYRVEGPFRDGDPDATLTVVDHLAASPRAAAALRRFALGIDWVRHVVVPNAAPDDPLPLELVNPRAARPVGAGNDDLWVRVLDGPRAFAARRYEAAGRVVLDVADAQGHLRGRWLLHAREDGTGTLAPTDLDADLALDAAAVGALYLGGNRVPQFAAAGLVEELRPGAAAELDRVLRTSVAPWCPDRF